MKLPHAVKGIVAFFMIVVMGLACSFSSSPRVEPQDMPPGVPRIAQTVRLLVTSEFADYVHISSHEGRKVTFTIGPGATEAVTALLTDSFDSVGVERVDNEADIYALVGKPADSLQIWDYVASPTLVNPTSYVVPLTAGYNLRIRVDFISLRGGRNLSIEGTGTGRANIWIASSVHGMGEEALRKTISSLRDDLEKKRPGFE